MATTAKKNDLNCAAHDAVLSAVSVSYQNHILSEQNSQTDLFLQDSFCEVSCACKKSETNKYKPLTPHSQPRLWDLMDIVLIVTIKEASYHSQGTHVAA